MDLCRDREVFNDGGEIFVLQIPPKNLMGFMNLVHADGTVFFVIFYCILPYSSSTLRCSNGFLWLSSREWTNQLEIFTFENAAIKSPSV